MLRDVLNQRLLGLSEALNKAATAEEIDEALKTLGGLYRFRRDNIGIATLKKARLGYGKGSYEVLAHGICGGGDCKTGGPVINGQRTPVFRTRACSRCIYRITGAPFLPGLVHRLNCLIVEIKASLTEEANLNVELERVRDDGPGSELVRGHIRALREEREDLWSEWCAELITIEQCLASLDGEPGSKLPLLTHPGEGDHSPRLEQVHQLVLLQDVIVGGRQIVGASIEVPSNVQAYRDAMLLEVARANDLSAFFLSLSPAVRSRALDEFGELLIAHAPEYSLLQQIVEGRQRISDTPSLDVAIQDLTSRVRQQRSRLASLEMRAEAR